MKFLQADASKAHRELDWEPKIHFRDLVRIMVDADLELVGLPNPGEGKKVLSKFSDGWHHWEQQCITMEH